MKKQKTINIDKNTFIYLQIMLLYVNKNKKEDVQK